MATDPYHAVQREVESSLRAADTLRASYLRIASTARPGSEELAWARDEVRAFPPFRLPTGMADGLGTAQGDAVRARGGRGRPRGERQVRAGLRARTKLTRAQDRGGDGRADVWPPGL
jgi:hypothetical protein